MSAEGNDCTPVATYRCACGGTPGCGCRLTDPPTHFHADGRYLGTEHLARDERWAGVRGGIVYDDRLEHRRLEVEVRSHGHVVGEAVLLRDDHPSELPYALRRIVRDIDEALHA